MGRAVAAVILVAVVATLAPLGVLSASQPAQRWIVQLEPGAGLDDVVSSARNRLGVRATHRFGHLVRGFAATFTASQRAALLDDPRVAAVVPDVPVHATGDPYAPNANEVQPGIRRVGADANTDRSGTSLDVDIAVLDTGIQPDNAELNVAGGYNCTDPSQSEAQRTDPSNWRDSAGFGHGTHVAGIAAALQNGRGVAGVAQGARLWAIKVLDDNGNGYWSWVICGLDRVAQMRDASDPDVPRIEVVNMSLAASGWDDGNCGLGNADLLHQAICRLADEGVTIVAAAGNAGRDAAGYVPAAYDEVITVSAMADWNGQPAGTSPGSPPADCTRDYSDDSFAGFSNYGADVDLIAPGTCVLSLLPIDELGLMTGTSMASPHVAGGAALYYLWEQRAGRPRPSPLQVRAALIARGTLDWLTSTDPDIGLPGGAREPALAVADFNLAPDFELAVSAQLVRVAAGSSVQARVTVVRLGGFDAAVGLAVEEADLPSGSSASFDVNPSAVASSESTLTIDVSAAASGGTYEVDIAGSGGGLAATTRLRLVVFDAVADAGSPWLRLRSGVETGADLIPVLVKWPKTANAQRYELQQSVDGGPWQTLAKPRRPKLKTSAWPGSRYQYRVRVKLGGTWREWRTGAGLVTIPYEPGALDLTGTWTSAPIKRAYSELPVYSSQAGAAATLDFRGTSVSWIASRGPTRGKARVLIDGVHVATIDLYAGSNQHRRVVFSRSWDALADHTLRIEVRGRPLSRPRVDVDAFVIISD